MGILLLNILMAMTWVLLSGDFTFTNFIQGLIISYVIIFLSQKSVSGSHYFKKIPLFISFIGFFLKEMFVANILVAYDILTPTNYMKPGIIAIPLSVKTDYEISLLANLITLTPGTLSLDISNDRKVLYIHAMYLDEDVEKFRQSIKNGFEKRIIQLMRKDNDDS